MNQAELEQALVTAGTTVAEIGANLTEAIGEIQTLITDLQTQIANGANTTPEVDATLTDLLSRLEAAKVSSKALADVVPNPAP